MTGRQGRQPEDARRPAGTDHSWADEMVLFSGEQPVAGPRAGTPAGPPRLVPTWLVAGAVLLACVAVALAALWWQHRSRVIEVTRQIRPYLPAGPDAAGCPSGSHCQVRSDFGQSLSVQARRLFPDATVLSSVSVTSRETGQTVQTTIVLQTPSGLEVSATAQCVPGAAPIPPRAAPLPVVGPAQADFVVPGTPGCSVAVTAQVPRAVPVPAVLLERLAGDPQVQLGP
ncbi:hypothetical protein [Jatrophihabitans sp.]|uniref:hypothetical protein n=1 Tax=Jatrophihabitans sp. TaxID=1932789 RepID=UPI002CBF0AB1|nr:hypothetical protein [Jatrophihabitans sp.]